MHPFSRIALVVAAFLIASPAYARHHHASGHAHAGTITCNHQGCSDRPQYQQQAYGYAYKASKTRAHARPIHIQGDVTITITKRHHGASAAVYDGNENRVHSERVIPHPAGCPSRQYCGCGASVEVFGHPVEAPAEPADFVVGGGGRAGRELAPAHAAGGLQRALEAALQ